MIAETLFSGYLNRLSNRISNDRFCVRTVESVTKSTGDKHWILRWITCPPNALRQPGITQRLHWPSTHHRNICWERFSARKACVLWERNLRSRNVRLSIRFCPPQNILWSHPSLYGPQNHAMYQTPAEKHTGSTGIRHTTSILSPYATLWFLPQNRWFFELNEMHQTANYERCWVSLESCRTWPNAKARIRSEPSLIPSALFTIFTAKPFCVYRVSISNCEYGYSPSEFE